ncbi:hypothetical protein [Streptomyces sp. NEAU-174]|uniref:hypothetical protein n=1 Tax=Streptomyces sp. NEAU-174 TaxID=3458254 RepID=UPI00404395C1
MFFGEICLLARLRLGLEPRDVGDLLRRSLHLDSELDGKAVDALLALALPPPPKRGAPLNVNVGDLAEDGGGEMADGAFDQRPGALLRVEAA